MRGSSKSTFNLSIIFVSWRFLKREDFVSMEYVTAEGTKET
jgi:hypothetical protein